MATAYRFLTLIAGLMLLLISMPLSGCGDSGFDGSASVDTASESSSTTTRAFVPLDPAKFGTVEREVTYGNAGDVDLKMDVYYPKSATGPLPVVMYVHGGGWTRGDKQDGAGGHLVSLLGVTDESDGLEGSVGYPDESSRVQAVVDMFGPSDLTREFEGGAIGKALGARVFGTSARDSEILKVASPVTYISADDPPFLILHGDSDELVPPWQSQELYNQLTAADVPATLVMVKNAGHGFSPQGGEVSPTHQEINRMIVDFFRQELM